MARPASKYDFHPTPTSYLSSEPHFEKSANFQSILFDELPIAADIDEQPPPAFTNLNLDQVVAAATSHYEQFNLKPFFYLPLSDLQTIKYRQEVFKDLEIIALRESIESFCKDMQRMRNHTTQAEKLHHSRQKQAWFLDAVEIYCEATAVLLGELIQIELVSLGFRKLRAFLCSYVESDEFVKLVNETAQLKHSLEEIKYCVEIQGKRITVTPYQGEPDYGAEVLNTFDKFKQNARSKYEFNFSKEPEINHVEGAILDIVAQLNSNVFLSLDQYCARHQHYLNQLLARFDREIHFYLAYLECIAPLAKVGLAFCLPVVDDQSKDIRCFEMFDLALALKLVPKTKPVITNDVYLDSPERIIIVSGPNQGGKTTFARVFGQLHYLGALGCPVPAREAKLFLFDNLFTHFEKEEDIRRLSGKLEDELHRIHKILELASPSSILIMNESFLSTSLHDALFLSKQILNKIIDLGMLCVSVTFLDELAEISDCTVSMVSTINPADPAARTFKILRREADGLAYAVALAEKHQLTYEQVKIRIAKNTERPIGS